MPTSNDTRLRVRIFGPTAKVRRFLSEFPLESQRVIFSQGRVRVDLHINPAQREHLLRLGLTIEREFDAFANLLERRKEISPPNQFDDRKIPPVFGRLLK